MSTLPDQWYADDFEVVSPTLKNTGQIFGTPVTLISSFLEGLGVTASPEEITPEIMKQVGGSLRVLLEHGKAEQEWLQKTQLSLCAHPEEVKASMSGMLSGELLQMSTSEILAILLNHREPLHAQFSKQLDSSCFFLRENLACLQQTTTNALLSVTEALSPKGQRLNLNNNPAHPFPGLGCEPKRSRIFFKTPGHPVVMLFLNR
ncbi:MAG: hypothetical protein HC848_01745 [Limnobacter sp.]|nr:hypothetical protein [Limnobacter sp.]